MLAFSALVAGSFALGGRAANLIDPAALNAVRFWLASLLVGGVVSASGGVPPGAFGAPWRFILLGGLFATYFVLMFEGLKTASPVSTSAVFTLTPILSAGFGWLLLRQRLTRRMALALAIGGVGALWVIFRADLGAALRFEIGRGEATFFFGVVAHALYTPLVRRLNRGERTLVFTLGVTLASAAILTLWGWRALAATPWGALPAIVWITIGYTTVFASASTVQLLQFAALRLPASKVMAYTYLTPSWVILWDIALGGTAPPPRIGARRRRDDPRARLAVARRGRAESPGSSGMRHGTQFGLQKPLERLQVEAVHLPEAGDPDRGVAQAVGLEPAPSQPAMLLLADQARLRQHRQMLRDRRERHRERRRHVGDGHVVFQQHGQDRPPRWVGKCQKHQIEPSPHDRADALRRSNGQPKG